MLREIPGWTTIIIIEGLLAKGAVCRFFGGIFVQDLTKSLHEDSFVCLFVLFLHQLDFFGLVFLKNEAKKKSQNTLNILYVTSARNE